MMLKDAKVNLTQINMSANNVALRYVVHAIKALLKGKCLKTLKLMSLSTKNSILIKIGLVNIPRMV
jgi:hypothetical protein